MIKKYINRLVDLLYLPIVARYIPKTIFRYGLCGGLNMVLDMVIYFLLFQFILQKSNLDLAIVVISPQIAAFLITFPIIFFTGLWLNRNISFKDSPLKSRTQAIRYMIVVCCNIAIKYFGLKLLVDVISIYPSISNAIMTVVTVIFSYFAQSRFSFRGANR